jgi:hypothetical protein
MGNEQGLSKLGEHAKEMGKMAREEPSIKQRKNVKLSYS